MCAAKKQYSKHLIIDKASQMRGSVINTDALTCWKA